MSGIHGYNFFCLLEQRLDNVVYRLGFAPTRRAARQLVNHGHVDQEHMLFYLIPYHFLKLKNLNDEKFSIVVQYRLGFAPTRRAARQLVNHGHFLVNGVKTDIPSFRVKVGDVVEVKEKSKNLAIIKSSLENRKFSS